MRVDYFNGKKQIDSLTCATQIINFFYTYLEVGQHCTGMSEKKMDTKGDPGPATSKVRRYDHHIYRLRRWILFGCDEVHKSAQKRSIGRWFVGETSVRVYRKEFTVNCLKLLDSVLTTLVKEGNTVKKEKCIQDIKNTFIDNKAHADWSAIALLLAQMMGYTTLRPIAAALINEIPLQTTDLMLFCKYVRKIKGNNAILRKSLIKWFQTNTTDPNMVKELLLRRSRVSWNHADIIKLWHIPDMENNIMKILLGFEPKLDTITDEKLRYTVSQSLKIRNLNSKIKFLKMLEDKEFMEEFGLDLVLLIKPNLFNREAMTTAVQLLGDNDFIQILPKMMTHFKQYELYGIKELWESVATRLSQIKPSHNIKPMSLYVTWRWFAWYLNLLKNNPSMTTVAAQIHKHLGDMLMSYPKFDDVVLFVAEWKKNEDFKDTDINLRKPKGGEAERPIVCPIIAKSIEFLALLMHLFPENELWYNNKYYKVQKYESILDLKEKLTTIEKLKGNEKTGLSFKKMIIFSLDDSQLAYPKLANPFDTLVVITKNKVKTNTEKLPLARKQLVIHGFDHNLLTLVDKCFHVL